MRIIYTIYICIIYGASLFDALTYLVFLDDYIHWETRNKYAHANENKSLYNNQVDKDFRRILCRLYRLVWRSNLVSYSHIFSTIFYYFFFFPKTERGICFSRCPRNTYINIVKNKTRKKKWNSYHVHYQ